MALMQLADFAVIRHHQLMSLLIFASVVSLLPSQMATIRANGGWVAVAMVLAGYALITVAIVYVEQGQRRIPVQFAKRVVGRRQYGGQSTYIPLGTIHRLANPGKVPLEIIEVQSGSYLGEDDIVRFEDSYGRATAPRAAPPETPLRAVISR